MYCEKCGKMNPEGAMFCSNCSSILRSRRNASAPSSAGTPKAEDATRRIPVTNTVKHEAPETVKQKVAEWENSYPSRKDTYSDRTRTRSHEEKPRRTYYEDYEEDYNGEKTKFCSAWCNVLSVVSWVIFIVMMAIGIIGGAALIAMGIKQNESMLYFAGAAVLILFVVMALAYHARNMVQIKILRKLNEKK